MHFAQSQAHTGGSGYMDGDSETRMMGNEISFEKLWWWLCLILQNAECTYTSTQMVSTVHGQEGTLPPVLDRCFLQSWERLAGRGLYFMKSKVEVQVERSISEVMLAELGKTRISWFSAHQAPGACYKNNLEGECNKRNKFLACDWVSLFKEVEPSYFTGWLWVASRFCKEGSLLPAPGEGVLMSTQLKKLEKLVRGMIALVGFLGETFLIVPEWIPQSLSGSLLWAISLVRWRPGHRDN